MSGSQKFIARNRAPRVQIEYDVELYGAQKKVQLPFVMGVFSDLSGKSEQPPVDDRKFLEIDVDNFDERMRAVAPRAAFTVPNTLTGEGNLSVDLTFNRMDDFSPEAIAENVEALRPLLEARRQLTTLATYMDGKAGAEALIEKLLSQPALLAAITGGQEQGADLNAALDSLRGAVPDTPQDDDTQDATLAALAAAAPQEADPDTSVDDALGTLTPPPESDAPDQQADALESLRDAVVPEAVDEDTTADVLGSIARVEDAPEPEDKTADVLAGIAPIDEDAPEDMTDDVLAGLAADVPQDVAPTDTTADVLAGIEHVDAPEADDQTDDILDTVAALKSDDMSDGDKADDILASLDTPEAVEAAEDALDDILGSIEAAPEAAPDGPDADDVLGGLEAHAADDTPDDTSDDILSDMAALDIETVDEGDSADDILAGLDAPEPEAEAGADLDDILSGMEAIEAPDESEDIGDILSEAATEGAVAEAEDTEDLDDILGGLEAAETEFEDDTDVGGILSGIADESPEDDADDDVSDILAGLDAPEGKTEDADDLGDILGGLEAVETEEDDADLSDILSGIADDKTADDADDDSTDDILAGLDDVASADDDADDLDDILGGLEAEDGAEDETDDLDDILGGLNADEAEERDTDLDDILGDISAEDPAPEGQADGDDSLAAMDTTTDAENTDDDLDDILAGLEDDTPDDAAGDNALDDVLAGLDAEEDEEGDPLDDILAGLDDDEDGVDDSALNDILGDAGDDDGSDDLDDLLAGLDDDDAADRADGLDDILGGEDDDDAEPAPPAQSPFGNILAARPARDTLNRRKFRMALFGDFTGRASRGVIEIGDALAHRTPITLDVDTVEDIIEGFATTLHLKIGKDNAVVPVQLKELDDLHPDELYDNVEMFQEISGLRQQLGMGSMADRTTSQLKEWSEAHASPIKLPKRSASTSVPANLKLSDFQALIGDTGGALTQADPADNLIAQIVGPHIVKAPDDGAAEMTKAVDEALSSAMRLILHHPDFQAIEAQWRSLDMLARRIETDSELEIVLYDVSAEELAADLAAQEDLGESGLFRLVTDVLDPEEGAGGFSALFGLYTFEETPPHAELLARIGQVGAHVDAPFFSAITPGYLNVAKEDRHPLVAEAWDTLRSLPEAAYLALSSPRFLLRLPYGVKSDPIYAFEFEEFTPREGLSGMLWANPVVLVAILLAGTYKKDGKAMDLGSLMSLGDLPFHYVTDRHGDQVALPCTERNLTSDAAQHTLGRGLMPVVWMKGRNEIRLGTFRSLGGDVIAGPWEDNVPAPRPRPGGAGQTLEMDIAAGDSQDSRDPDTGDGEDDDILAGLGLDDDVGDDDDTSLDDLLAGFDDDGGEDDDDDDEEMDAELAALLEGL